MLGALLVAAAEPPLVGPLRVADVAFVAAALLAHRHLGRLVTTLLACVPAISVFATLAPSSGLDVVARVVAFVAVCAVAVHSTPGRSLPVETDPRRAKRAGSDTLPLLCALGLPALLLGREAWLRSHDVVSDWTRDSQVPPAHGWMALSIVLAAAAGLIWHARPRPGARRRQIRPQIAIAIALGASAHVTMLSLLAIDAATWDLDTMFLLKTYGSPTIGPIEVGAAATAVLLAAILVRSIATLIRERRDVAGASRAPAG